MDTEENKFILTKHVKKRYVQRIVGKEDQNEILRYLNLYDEKITTDILKMLQYAELIYSGKSFTEYNKTETDVYLNGTWIIIVGHNTQSIITLYKIDLGVGEDFNKEYVKKLREEYEEIKQIIDKDKEEIESTNEEMTKHIEENNRLIESYKSQIKTLEDQNESYKILLETSQDRMDIRENELRKVIGKMVGRKIY